MEITKTQEGTKLTVAVSGRLDTNTAPELDAAIKESIEGMTEVVLDIADLEYISSAGLRVLLSTQKTMMRQGSMKVINVQEPVMEVLEVTGFSDILTIE